VTRAVDSVVTEFLKNSSWGRLLESHLLQDLIRESQVRHIPKGGSVCRNGSEVKFWKGIFDGLIKVSIVSSDGKISTLTGIPTGSWFGESEILRSQTWGFDGIALRETQVVLIPKACFLRLLDLSPIFNRYVIMMLNERLAQFASIIKAERLEKINARVAQSLALLYNPILYPDAAQKLELTQQEIGYLCGIPRQRINAALNVLQLQGLLEIRYGSVHIIDAEKLLLFDKP
jgi:CRP/FNR family transcriptional regulator, cyclic AMP receptor protein